MYQLILLELIPIKINFQKSQQIFSKLTCFSVCLGGTKKVARAEDGRGFGRVVEAGQEVGRGRSRRLHFRPHWNVARVGHRICRRGRKSKHQVSWFVNRFPWNYLKILKKIFRPKFLQICGLKMSSCFRHYIRAPALNDNDTFCSALASRVLYHLRQEIPNGRIFSPQLGLRCPKCTNPSCVDMRKFFAGRRQEFEMTTWNNKNNQTNKRFATPITLGCISLIFPQLHCWGE